MIDTNDETADLTETSINPWMVLEPNSAAELAWIAAETKRAGKAAQS